MAMAKRVPSGVSRKPASDRKARALLAWYDANRRELPWRAGPGVRPDPYRVWLSEIMLQQTTAAAVGSYYTVFLKRWPTVKALAAASQDEVLGAWAGLGYYSRARNLHRTARIVAGGPGGHFPDTADGLRKLPGVGAYTAGAVAAIAFGERAVAMDANAERAIARLFAVEEPLPKAKKRLAALAGPLVPATRPGDFAQAMMDLGALVCTPKRPLCVRCPWMRDCEGRKREIAESLPRKGAKKPRPVRRGAAFVALDRKGFVYLERRPENGLLGAMLQPPLGPWREEFPAPADAAQQAPFKSAWKKRPGVVRHGFTHFVLEMEIYVALFKSRPKADGSWFAPDDLSGAALPTAMRKMLAHAADAPGPPRAHTKVRRC